MTDQASNWTVQTLYEHYLELRNSDQRFYDERDRRYGEVNIEREKALKIKETADAEALRLARESQAYKDQQNDALRDETLGKSGIYATNAGVSSALKELEDTFFKALKPLTDFVSQQTGAARANTASAARVYGIAAIVATFGGGLVAALLKALGL